MQDYSDFIETDAPMISAHKVLERWPGVNEKDLAELIDLAINCTGITIRGYLVHRVFSNGKGKSITECLPCKMNDIYDGKTYDFTRIAFRVDDIVKYEMRYPKVLYKIVENYDEAWASNLINTKETKDESEISFQREKMNGDCSNSANNEFYKTICEVLARGLYLGEISPEFIADNLQTSPPVKLNIKCLNDVLDVLNSVDAKDPIKVQTKKYLEIMQSCDFEIFKIKLTVPQGTNFFEEKDDTKKIVFIQSLFFLILRYVAAARCASQVGLHMGERCKEAESIIASLEASSAEQMTSRTQAATLARKEKTLSAWKPAIDAMIKVAVRCGEEGRILRQQPDLNVMFNDLDAVLSDAQMALFRKALPDEHIDRTGGPRGKGVPS